ncbi:MAG: polyribonucleotide nucleotidyltransferase [Verrucomicrobiia bacterium]
MATKVSARTGNSEVIIETGKIARQANGSVTVQLGETIVIVAAVAAAEAKEGQEFFPLTVDYREKAAAAGRFPGGYFKREGRPTEKEILTSRLIDRPIRPLFPKGWYNEVQVQAIVLSADGENDPDILSVNGASAALMISDIPWEGPIGAVRIGRIDGQFVINPTHSELEKSDLDLIYVGNETDLIMFEGSAKEVSEEDFKKALHFAHEAIQPLIAAQKELASVAGKQKRAITQVKAPEEIVQEIRNLLGDRLVSALLIREKLAREAACKQLFDEINPKLQEKFSATEKGDNTEFLIKSAFEQVLKETIRNLILKEGKRLDGRGFDELRPIHCEVGILPRAHGSALFSRGETQSIALATLGTPMDAQELDAYTGGETEKKFILHYNFPNFSTGETGRISGPGRREIGHGALAERSIEPLLKFDDYPYTIRISSEIMESNGSTSMATVCAGSLALMDAGIPIQRHVAGISIGLCTEYDQTGKISQYKLLTDIIGWEDAFCDMDCKIAGTEIGITGFQLDLKLKGIPISIIEEAVEKAKIARTQILDLMRSTIAAPKPEISKYAPRYESFKINTEKIGIVIGPNGKNIKKIIEDTGCEIEIKPDGTVTIFGINSAAIAAARQAVETFSAEPEVGKVYKGKVVTITDFGAFVEFLPGQDGLVHVSELADHRVKNVEDIVKVGDEILVKCLGIDEKNRVRLSRKAALEEQREELLKQSAAAKKSEIKETKTADKTDQSQPEDSQLHHPDETPSQVQEIEKPVADDEQIEKEFEETEEQFAPEEQELHSEELSLRPQEQRKFERKPFQRHSNGRPQRHQHQYGRAERQERQQRPMQQRQSERQVSSEEPQVGKNYRGRVTSTKEYGAFIEFLPGREGLCHISELANFRVKRTEDIVKVGDEITVKYLGLDEKGRIKLSRKAVILEREQSERQENS